MTLKSCNFLFQSLPHVKTQPSPRSRVRPSVSSGVKVDLRVTTKTVPANRATKQLCHVLGLDKVSVTTHVSGEVRKLLNTSLYCIREALFQSKIKCFRVLWSVPRLVGLELFWLKYYLGFI